PRGTAMPRLETVVDMLLEIQHLWQEESPGFRPEHEVNVRRHIGDYTLFMTGLFPERVQRTASMGYYVSEGKRAYRFVFALERALRELADAQGASALPVLVALGDGGHGGVRRAAKRALYRLSQRGIAPPPRAASRPVVERGEKRPVRAWVSAVDGSGSRAMWILFDGAFGSLELCSLIVNDTAGILEVAGGSITRKRLESA